MHLYVACSAVCIRCLSGCSIGLVSVDRWGCVPRLFVFEGYMVMNFGFLREELVCCVGMVSGDGSCSWFAIYWDMIPSLRSLVSGGKKV